VITVFARTAVNVLRSLNVFLYLLFIEGLGIAFFYIVRFLVSNAMIGMEVSDPLSFFLMLCFLWFTGLPLVVFIIHHGTRLIAGEKEEGTLLLLVSKPPERYQILLGKWLALVISSIILGICSTVLALTLFTIIIGFDSVIIGQFWRNSPQIGLYIVFLVISVSVISLFFSVLCFSSRKVTGILSGISVVVYLIIFVTKPFATGMAGLFSWFDYLPLTVIILWIVLCLCILAFAIRKFQKMDISF